MGQNHRIEMGARTQAGGSGLHRLAEPTIYDRALKTFLRFLHAKQTELLALCGGRQQAGDEVFKSED